MSIFQPKYKVPKTEQTRISAVWWCNFTYKGQRVRESTGQTKKTLARGL